VRRDDAAWGKDVIGAVSNIMPSLLGYVPSGTSPGGGSIAGFGPDFLVGVFSSQVIAGGAMYDANGQLVVLEDRSPDARLRENALTEAKTLLKAGDPAAARAAANRVLSRDAGDAIAAAYVGRTYMAEGDYKSAVKYLARAASGSDLDQIRVDLKAAQTLSRGEAAALKEIQRLMRQPATSTEGAQLATYLLDRNPESLDARFELADFYERMGRVTLAGAELADALLTAKPDGLDRLVGRIERFTRAHAQDASAHDLLAQGYVRTGRIAEAQEAFAQALERAGENAEFKTQLKQDFAGTFSMLARAQRARGNEAEAIRLYEQGLAVFSSDEAKGELSDLALQRGERELRSGQLRLALEDLNLARAYLPGTADPDKARDLIAAYESLATKFTTAGDLKSAVAARLGAYLLDPSNDTRKRALADAYDGYGLNLMDGQDYLMAARQFRAALTYYTTDAAYAQHLAEAEGHL
jgi:tetratricopeptide (TPR) repeat protein